MRRLGPILIGLGGALIAFSFVSGFVGAGQSFGFFPGLILIFLGRAVSRVSRDSESDTTTVQQQPQSERRPMNTEISRPPVARREPPKPDPVVEEILTAGRQLHEEIIPDVDLSPVEVSDDGEFRPMSSEEMVQRARRRWDSDR